MISNLGISPACGKDNEAVMTVVDLTLSDTDASSPEVVVCHKARPPCLPGPIVKGPACPLNAMSCGMRDAMREYQMTRESGSQEGSQPADMHASQTTTSSQGTNPVPKQVRKRRTPEERARDEAIRRASRARQKQLSTFTSVKCALQQITVILDVRLMETETGLAIGGKLRETQNGPPEKMISYSVRDGEADGFKAVRWRRQILDEDPETIAEDSLEEELATREVDMPHVLISLEAAEFVSAWEADQLSSLMSLLSRQWPSFRHHLLVTGLQSHLTKLERTAHATQMMQPGARVFCRAPLENFLASLPIYHPDLCLRQAEDAHAAAEHVVLLSNSIARSCFAKSESAEWLQAHNRRIGKPMDALLAEFPVDPVVEQAMRALCVLPSVVPQIAHAILKEFGSIGRLMDQIHEAYVSGGEALQALQIRIEGLLRVGARRPTRVGPKAAGSVTQWLTCHDPDRQVYEDDEST